MLLSAANIVLMIREFMIVINTNGAAQFRTIPTQDIEILRGFMSVIPMHDSLLTTLAVKGYVMLYTAEAKYDVMIISNALLTVLHSVIFKGR